MRDAIIKHKKSFVANARIFLILSVVFIISLSMAGCDNEDEFLPEASSDFVYTTIGTEQDHPTNENNIIPHEEVGYCGNTVTTVSYRYSGKDTGEDEDWTNSFMGSDSVMLTDLLRYLDYSNDICKCLPEYIVDTEFGKGYGINLTEGYARYEGKQVSLTDGQIKTVTEIFERAKNDENK